MKMKKESLQENPNDISQNTEIFIRLVNLEKENEEYVDIKSIAFDVNLKHRRLRSSRRHFQTLLINKAWFWTKT